jgi:hypothetical protein
MHNDRDVRVSLKLGSSTGANLTIASYNASVVNFYSASVVNFCSASVVNFYSASVVNFCSATGSLARIEHKNKFYF